MVILLWLLYRGGPLSFGVFSVLVLRGAVDTQLEPWTGLHCSELYWRCPVELSVVQSGAPVSSKVCQHGSVCGCDVVTLRMAYSMEEWPGVICTAYLRSI